MIQYCEDLKSFRTHPYRMKRLQPYFDYMSQDREKPIFDDNVAEVLSTQGFTCSESPRSIYHVDKLFDSLGKFAPGRIDDPVITDEIMQGVALARTCFLKPRDEEFLHPLPFNPKTIMTITSKPSASAGLTAYGSTKEEAMTRALERGLQILSGEKGPEPCLAFARTQFNDKTRLVWGYPYSMTCIEGLIAYPLIQRFKDGCTPMAFAIPSGSLGTKLRVAAYHNKYAYSLDMSSFDASVSNYLIRQAFKIIRSWFDPDEVEPVSGKTVKQLIDVIENYFVCTPIVMPDGNIYSGKRHGVPSGSYFTQIVDSIANVIIAGTVSAKYSMNVSRREIFVLGDDLIMWTDRRMDLGKLANYATSTFGVQFNAAKSSRYNCDEPIHYLGRIWTNGIPDLPINEVVQRACYPERFRKYSKNPEDRAREVRLLLFSYAAVYYCMWSVVDEIYGPSRRYGHGGGGLDTNTYLFKRKVIDVDPEMLSGLERYMRIYVRRKSKEMPHTALLFWL